MAKKGQRLVHSVQLWEHITRKKAPYTVKHVDSFHQVSEKEARWLEEMEKTIEDWNPQAHGYKVYRARVIGHFFEKTENGGIA